MPFIFVSGSIPHWRFPATFQVHYRDLCWDYDKNTCFLQFQSDQGHFGLYFFPFAITYQSSALLNDLPLFKQLTSLSAKTALDLNLASQHFHVLFITFQASRTQETSRQLSLWIDIAIFSQRPPSNWLVTIPQYKKQNKTWKNIYFWRFCVLPHKIMDVVFFCFNYLSIQRHTNIIENNEHQESKSVFEWVLYNSQCKAVHWLKTNILYLSSHWKPCKAHVLMAVS